MYPQDLEEFWKEAVGNSLHVDLVFRVLREMVLLRPGPDDQRADLSPSMIGVPYQLPPREGQNDVAPPVPREAPARQTWGWDRHTLS